MQDVLEPHAKMKARLEPGRGEKRESPQPLSDLEEEVENTTFTVPVVCGSDSKRIELEYGCSCRFFCGCDHEG